MLAWVYESLGDLAATRRAIALAEELGGPEDVINYAITRTVRARMALTAGDGEAAEHWARSAVEYAFQMNTPWVRGHAQLELARVVMALGRYTEAASDARLALHIYKDKGDRPGAAQANALLHELAERP
jgi:ATP/maltotriose-dependent transcriptional regulator MalT